MPAEEPLDVVPILTATRESGTPRAGRIDAQSGTVGKRITPLARTDSRGRTKDLLDRDRGPFAPRLTVIRSGYSGRVTRLRCRVIAVLPCALMGVTHDAGCAVLLKPLPYADAGRLVSLNET